ncbi:MAG: hypothetical protein KDE25_00490 [Novosphingobium sp.]|nr:hypothetical protein [Novosphingobium sp.]
MARLTIELQGEDPVTLDDMGEGTVILSQHSETHGRLERIATDYGQLRQALEALRPRYGSQDTKNTEPEGRIAA